nr:unnamed protein product [Digitaria exilis]
MDRLAEAVEELELLTAPGGALDRLFSVFGHRGTTTARRGDATSFGECTTVMLSLASPLTARGTDMVHMDVNGVPPAGGARHRHGKVSGGAESFVAGAGLPVPGAKRKRGVIDPGSTSHGVVDTELQKRRRVVPWMRHSASFGSRFLAAPPPQLGSSSEDRARTVALAMARVRRRIGMPTRRRRQAVLRQHFSRFSLQ